MTAVKILGTGCTKCDMLAREVKAIAKEMNIKITIVKVTEMREIVSFGVMTTPALVVNEKVKMSGSIPNREEIKKMLK